MYEVGLIPEVEIYKILKQMRDITINNTVVETNKELTILWRIFGDNEFNENIKLDTYNLYEQALSIFHKNNAKRGIEIGVGYNMARVESGEPSIHILLPNENMSEAPIGDGEGYAEEVVDNSKNLAFSILSANSEASYNLLITTDNVNELLIVYHWLKSTSLTFSSQFALRNMQNVRIGGNDLQFNDELVPPNVFHRNFNLSFTYDYFGINLFGNTMATGIIGGGEME